MPKRWAKHGLACVADIKTFEQRPVLSSLLYYADLWDRGVAAAAAMPKAAVEFNLDRPHFRQLAVKWEENIKFYGTKTGEGFASMAVSDLRVFKLMPISWKIISKTDLRCFFFPGEKACNTTHRLFPRKLLIPWEFPAAAEKLSSPFYCRETLKPDELLEDDSHTRTMIWSA